MLIKMSGTPSETASNRDVINPSRIMNPYEDFYDRKYGAGMDDFNGDRIREEEWIDDAFTSKTNVNCSFPSPQTSALAATDGEIPPAEDDGCTADQTGRAVSCQFHNMIVDSSKMRMKNTGGEELSAVMGQAEEDEMIQSYDKGAFLLRQGSTVPLASKWKRNSVSNPENLHYLEDVMNAMALQTDASDPCNGGRVVETPTLFITRYEYVDLHHTMGDWFNAYGVSAAASKKKEKFNVVFLDGHPKGHLDDAWSSMLGGTALHVKSNTGPPTCFRRAIFVPPGYTSPINKNAYCDPVPAMMSSFVDFILESFRLPNLRRVKKKVVILKRLGYISHPRSDPSKMTRVVSNLDVLKSTIEKVTPEADVTIVQIEALPLEEQARIIRSAEILIGMAGEGMASTLFMDKDSLSIEIDAVSSDYSFVYDWLENKEDRVHLQISSNIAFDANGSFDQDFMDKIAEKVKMKVDCGEGLLRRKYYDNVVCGDENKETKI